MKVTRAVSLAILFVTGMCGPIPAQTPAVHPRVGQALELARIWLEAQRAFDQIPGVSAAIIHDQQVLWAGGYGFADLSEKRPARADTIYSICSISKLFTSVAVLQQRDAGKLRLDDPVSRFLPWFRIKPSDGESADVTVEGLLRLPDAVAEACRRYFPQSQRLDALELQGDNRTYSGRPINTRLTPSHQCAQPTQFIKRPGRLISDFPRLRREM